MKKNETHDSSLVIHHKDKTGIGVGVPSSDHCAYINYPVVQKKEKTRNVFCHNVGGRSVL